MANLDRPRGFELYGSALRVRPYVAGSACYPGDLVSIASDGKVDPCAAGTIVLGVCMSYAAADLDEVLVADHPDQLIVGQAAAAEIDAQTDVGNCADIVAGSPDTTYKTSRQEIDGASLATSTCQLLILGVERRPNNALGANVAVVCKINEHQLGNASAGYAGV
jgi:hypothetical protein